MNSQTVTFYVASSDSVITGISKSFVETPPINFAGGEIKWFDDSTLYKNTMNEKE